MESLASPRESSGSGSVFRISVNETPISSMTKSPRSVNFTPRAVFVAPATPILPKAGSMVTPQQPRSDSGINTSNQPRIVTPQVTLVGLKQSNEQLLMTPICRNTITTETPKRKDKRRLSARKGNQKLGLSSAKKSCISTPRRTFTPGTGPSPKAVFALALIESRNKRQVGIAVMNLRSPELDLFLFADNQTYQSTLRLINLYEPIEVLISDTAVGTSLHSILRAELKYSTLSVFQRKNFNEDQGQLALEQKASKESLNQLTLGSNLFLCLAATNCLLKWVAYEQTDTFAPNSIKVTLKTLDGHMAIDISTIKTLELVTNALNHKSKIGSLFSFLNQCKTPLGERLLRANLLQPIRHIPTINSRLDAVQELLEQEEVFFDMLTVLPSFALLDLLCNGLAMVPNDPNERTAQQTIMNLLRLKTMLGQIPVLREITKRCVSDIFVAVAVALDIDRCNSILAEIDKVIQPDTSLAMSSSSENLHARLAFAVKPEISGLLDVGRATYCEIVEEINEEIQKYVSEFSQFNIKTHFTVTRGWHMSLPNASMDELSQAFIQRTTHGKRTHFSTDVLISLDDRRKECLGEVLLLTDRCLEELSVYIRKNMHWFLTVAESISLLDLVVCFANVVTLNEDYVRPMLTKDGPVAISKGRSPVREKAPNVKFMSNDTFLNETSRLQIVTGPNGSGKSTFLRQVGLIVIMAHIGSFVPAQYASIPSLDQLFTRMSHGDDLEGNASAFVVEAREAAYIVSNMTKSSLVLVDELGRSTSSIDGIGIAWAMCEEMLAKQCYGLFVTHFHELTDLPRLYPQVKNIRLKVNSADSNIHFCYSVAEGACDEIPNHFGVYIAELAMFPVEITEAARKLSACLYRELNVCTPQQPSNARFYDTVQKLTSLRYCSLPQKEITRYLIDIRDEMFPDGKDEEESDSENCQKIIEV